MEKPMFNSREPASGEKVKQIQDFYKEVYPAISSYESQVYVEKRRNEKPLTLKNKIIGYLVFLGLVLFTAGMVYALILAIENIKDTFLLSMSILGVAIGTPFTIIASVIFYIAKLPEAKEVNIKYPLKKEEIKFRKMISELGIELGTGKELEVFIDSRLSGISFKESLPKHILFRGSNDDPSKRSFLFEIIDDEITILLPDAAGVYKYDKKPKLDGSGIPDGNSPRYAAEGIAIATDTFF